MWIIWAIIIGLIAGFIARAVVPGSQPMSVFATIGLGLLGSFVGGFLGWLIFGRDPDSGALQMSGLLGSIIGAIIALVVLNALNRSTT